MTKTVTVLSGLIRPLVENRLPDWIEPKFFASKEEALELAPQAEIGWFPVALSPAARDAWLSEAFPDSFPAFHWHGDTFALPSGFVPLGASPACANQGFLGGKRANVLGLQFHPEVTAESVGALVAACGDELRPAPYVQDAAALREGLGHAAALNAMLARACDRLAAATA